jgi:hypothetical protein
VLTCHGPAGPGTDDPHALELARALARHPLAGALNGTIAIGIGGTNPWRATDAGPRVAVLTGNHDLTRVQRAHLALADGIVTTDPLTARAATVAAPHALVVIVPGDGRAFLRGATPRESAEAWGEVGDHRALAQALGGEAGAHGHAQAAELVVELVVALGN